MDDISERFIALINDHGEKAVIGQLVRYCDIRVASAQDVASGASWRKLAYRLRGALDGMGRGQFGRVR